MNNQYCRVTVLTKNVGPMIRQWTLESAITLLRFFVSGVTVEQGDIKRWVVTSDMVEARRMAREQKIAGRNIAVVETDRADPAHVCKICGKVLKNIHELVKHEYTHRKYSERPFTCKFCQKKFNQKVHLQTHTERRHKGQ